MSAPAVPKPSRPPAKLGRSPLAESRKRDLSEQFLRNMRFLRTRQGISVKVLAETITAGGYPISRSSLANFESGYSAHLPLDLAAEIAAALGRSLAVMLCETCDRCGGAPPEGFACMACGTGVEA